ncbi:MAG: VOC family protein [Candidatus Marinimicrobia bacterium]|nr:VOC family protein [Candidatus Neomarinimicrobiota bacterium]
MLRKLDIVVILVEDWPAAVRWYTQKLGLKVAYKEDDDQWCQLSFPDGGTNLALYGKESVDQSVQNRCLPDILVENPDETVKELKGRGIKFRGDIRGGDEGFRIIALQDPEGNELQLYEWI